jgi:hypothetical protein
MAHNYLGGVMAKSVRITAFLEPKTYLELINEAKTKGITAKTDSGLLNKIIYYFVNEVPGLTIDIHHKQGVISAQAEKIEALKDELATIKGKKEKH